MTAQTTHDYPKLLMMLSDPGGHMVKRVADARFPSAGKTHTTSSAKLRRVRRFPPELHPMDVDALLRVRMNNRKGGDMSEWPEDLRVRELPR